MSADGPGGLAGITNGAFISEPPRFIDNAIKTFSTLREVAGPDIELAVDFHGRAHQRNRPAHYTSVLQLL